MTTLDNPKKAQDNTSENTEGTSEKKPETFTKEQVQEVERKAKSDALADVGRLQKAADTSQKAAQAANERIEQILKDQEDAELKAAAGDEERLSAVKERQERRKTESKLAEVRRELDGKDEELKAVNAEKAEATKERNAREIASRLSVDAKSLAKLAKFTDGSTEAIEELAKELPKKEVKDPLKVDSGKTIGAQEDLSSLSQLERAGRELKLAKQMQAKRRTGEDDTDYKP